VIEGERSGRNYGEKEREGEERNEGWEEKSCRPDSRETKGGGREGNINSPVSCYGIATIVMLASYESCQHCAVVCL